MTVWQSDIVYIKLRSSCKSIAPWLPWITRKQVWIIQQSKHIIVFPVFPRDIPLY